MSVGIMFTASAGTAMWRASVFVSPWSVSCDVRTARASVDDSWPSCEKLTCRYPDAIKQPADRLVPAADTGSAPAGRQNGLASRTGAQTPVPQSRQRAADASTSTQTGPLTCSHLHACWPRHAPCATGATAVRIEAASHSPQERTSTMFLRRCHSSMRCKSDQAKG